MQEERHLTAEIRSAAAETMNALVQLLEEAESLAIRSIPKSPATAQKHLAHLQTTLSEAATLAGAVAIIMKGATRG